ncbi:hypothetical protein HL653_00655 [Sphingomonas sp. AP4-R1]|uniref:hypothetical protein n=1 Tax=Sphingomonas sp. AP4-R1 TaxID=2735134 RepID=UPI0014933BB2|nr:hypothetical protein [Sphingomonas sp. AP4-R1]QJU56491.1 hypothetical protein HL653_00655 [Sphingomonas sp. AP4-R1]
MKISKIERSKLANSGDTYKALLASDADWFVRTADDLRQLRTEDKEGGLAKLSDDVFERFVASCTFANGGIAGGKTAILTTELGLKSIFEIFNRFGADDVLILSWQERDCDPNTHHCTWDFTSFCSDTTCKPIIVAADS